MDIEHWIELSRSDNSSIYERTRGISRSRMRQDPGVVVGQLRIVGPPSHGRIDCPDVFDQGWTEVYVVELISRQMDGSQRVTVIYPGCDNIIGESC